MDEMDEEKPARAAAVIFATFAALFACELVIIERIDALVFEKMNVELPATTTFLVELAHGFVDEWPVALPAVIAAAAAGTLALRRVPPELERVARLVVLAFAIGLVVIAVPLAIYGPIWQVERGVAREQ
jgi:type II secretory pathway component PulF